MNNKNEMLNKNQVLTILGNYRFFKNIFLFYEFLISFFELYYLNFDNIGYYDINEQEIGLIFHWNWHKKGIKQVLFLIGSEM